MVGTLNEPPTYIYGVLGFEIVPPSQNPYPNQLPDVFDPAEFEIGVIKLSMTEPNGLTRIAI